jgi:putative transcriptional regulator
VANSHTPSWGGLAPAAGRLLIAAPTLTDPSFEHSVVYLMEHDDEGGTVGLILNRPTRTPVAQVLPSWHDAASEPAVVFGGGPVLVDGALGLARIPPAPGPADADLGGPGGAELGEPVLRPVSDGLATVDLDGDVALATATASQLRIFAGHSGWGPGQLAEELAAGGWFVVPGSLADVFSEQPRELWTNVLRRQPPPLSLMSTYPRERGLN